MTEVTVDRALQLGLQLHQAERLGEAEDVYRQVLTQHPRNPDAMHLLGLLFGQKGRLEESIVMISNAVAIEPTIAAFHCNLGESYRRLGKLDFAVEAFHRGLKLDPDNAVARSNLGAALRDLGRLDESIAQCRAAIARDPNLPDAHSNLGNALKDQGKFDEAIESCRRAISIRPNLAEAHNTLGSALLGLGRVDDAIESFRAAIAHKRTLGSAHNNLGNALRGKRQYEQAVSAYRDSIEVHPNSPDAHYNLAIALRDMGQFEGAIAEYEKAIVLKPDHAEAYNNLGNLVRYRGDLDRAVDCFLKAIQFDPNHAQAYNNLGGARTDQGRLDDALEQFRKSMALRPGAANVHSNYCYTIHFHPDFDSEKILQANRQWAAEFESPLAIEIIAPHNDRDPARRLRIGYVSPDFRIHAAACFILPLLAHHNADNVEIYCYASVKRPDAMTAKMHELNHVWRNCAGLFDAEMAELIRADRIDILVDLTLHMADNRLLVFARKPAPIQMTWLGYPSTTGMRSIDYRLTDQYLDPDLAADRFYSEQSIRLPNSFWCYQPLIDDTPDINALPAMINGWITFGCFNNFAKVTPATLQLWSRVLNAIPGSRLLLQSHPGRHRDDVMKIFQDNGIGAGRIEFVGKALPADYFRYYHRVDLCLDPTPYPGHTSSLDALWMGVPSVTLAGSTAASRGGASILSNVGLPGFIAKSEKQYVAIAARWSADLHGLGKLRASLREMLRASPLMNAPQFCSDLESVYRRAWHAWCTRAG